MPWGFQTGQVLGILAGPLLGGLISDFFSYRTTFRVTGVLALIAGIAVLYFIREEFIPMEEPKRTFSWNWPEAGIYL